MKDPVRLLDGGGGELERALLHAGANEEPPADGAARLAAVLGVSFGAAVSASTASAAARSSVAPAAKSAALGLKGLLLVAGAVAVGVAGIAVYRGGDGRGPSAERGGAVPAGLVARTETGNETVAVNENVAVHENGNETVAENENQAEYGPRPGSGPESGARTPRARSIAGEISALDRARERLADGDARGALGALERYRAAFPGGVLQQEASVLRIEALARAGERAQAQRLAQRFAREHPSSPHLERIRALIGGDAR